MALTNFDEDPFQPDDLGGIESAPEPERKPGNKNFLIAISILGILFVLALVALLLVAPNLLANQRAAQQEQAAQINAANTATVMAATAMAQAQEATRAAQTAAAAAAAAIPTKTPVVVVQTKTPVVVITSQLSAAELATVAALQTQMAAQGGAGTVTATALPTSGFADEVGLPLMGFMALLLVAIIILSRKLRLSSR